MRVALGLALAVGAFAAPSVAQASGFDTPIIGNAQASPVNPDATAVHHNPATLAFLDSGQFVGGAGILAGQVSYTRNRRGQYQFADSLQFKEPIDPNLIDPARSGVAETVRSFPVSAVGDLFVAFPLHKRVTLGAGLYVPYAAVLDLPEDGAQRYSVRDATLIFANLAVGASVLVHEKVSLGAGIAYQFGLVEFSQVQDFAEVTAFADAFSNPPINQDNDFGPNAPSTIRELESLSRPVYIQRAISHGVSFNAGITIRPLDALMLSLAYQHGSRVRARGDFTLVMDDPLFTDDLESQGIDFDPVVTGDVDVELRLPHRITLGVGGDVSKRVRLDGSFAYVLYRRVDKFDVTLRSPQLAQPDVGLTDTQRQEIPLNMVDTVDARFNVRLALTPKTLLSAGAGYQSPSSTDESITVTSIDGHRLLWTLGLDQALGKRVGLLVDARVAHLLPREVTESRNDKGNGTYNLVLGVVSVHLRIAFGKSPTRSAPSMPRQAATPPRPTPEPDSNSSKPPEHSKPPEPDEPRPEPAPPERSTPQPPAPKPPAPKPPVPPSPS